jgi:DNA processing protein
VISAEQHRLLTLCAVKIDGQSLDWSLIARAVTRQGGLDRLYARTVDEDSKAADAARGLLRAARDEHLEQARARVDSELRAAAKVGARVTTVLDQDYPANLRLVPDLPPFLFFRGAVEARDARSLAVVGTRQATARGLSQARVLAHRLAEDGVTVVSGLARGIDTAAHTAALEAGGRTIAVLGTGITKCYPPENAGLAERITAAGALVSQFWPTSGAARWTFPRRNVITSGISQGSVVVEASATSGAKMQARIALEHRKRVFLLSSLVTAQPWAQSYLSRGAIEVGDVEDVLPMLAPADRVARAGEQRQQLHLELA